ncbi:hypothetical protein REPUB_Repub04eG0224300 [Reevesia pubescens]
MGRSRIVSRSIEEDLNQSRSKRKRTASGVVENAELPLTVCSDFDLCVECFSVGAEVTPHKSNHPYRVMDNCPSHLFVQTGMQMRRYCFLRYSYTLSCIFRGIEMYGFGNWTEVAEHVGTKSKSQYIDHYLSHVMGKSREELLAMATGNGQVRKEFTAHGEVTLKEESPIGAKIWAPRKEDPTHQSSSSLTGVVTHSLGAGKKISNMTQSKDGINAEEPQADRSTGEKKPRLSTDEELSMTELSGYNFKRQEFEIEYDNDAEHLLADMEFKDTDAKAENELKLRVQHIYSKSTLDDWDITGFIGADLLSDTEKHLCREIRILPSHYLSMLQTLSVEIIKGNISKTSDAHNLFKVEPSKVDRVYDMLVIKGIAQA